jgi:protein SCO1/2
VERLAAAARSSELAELFEESHPVYAERGTVATVRMRGWVLCVLAREGLKASQLVFALEELDNGRDAYLVAAAARALRSHQHRSPLFAPYLARALSNIRFHDDALDLARYGGYAVGAAETTALREVLQAIAWLGADAHALVPVLQELVGEGRRELSAADAEAARRALSAIAPEVGSPADCCSGGLDFLRGLHAFTEWAPAVRRGGDDLRAVVFEDQSGRRIAYDAFFRGQPSVVAFFYTRCDNPEKCSLTVSKLGRVVRLLAERALSTRVRTAAVSYDAAWDVPERLAGYAKSRDLPFDENHRLLRAVEGERELFDRFELGVGFIESLVNRHRVELFVLDAEGRIAASFERLTWDELSVVEQVTALLADDADDGGPPPGSGGSPPRSNDVERQASGSVKVRAAPELAKLMTPPALAVVTAFFPKCPVCWAAYLSVFGVAGLDSLPYSPWLLPVFVTLLLVNLVSVRRRSASQGTTVPFWLTAAGAAVILVLGLGLKHELAGRFGVGLSLLGALASAFGAPRAGGAWSQRGSRQRMSATPRTSSDRTPALRPECGEVSQVWDR